MSENSKNLVIALIKYNCKVNESVSKALKPFGVSFQQFNVLRILRGQKGVAANLSTVHERMVNRTSNTTRIIDKLSDKNLVKRNICKENRRKIELFITNEGLKLLSVIDTIVEKTEDKATQKLNEKEKEKLIALLKQIND
ncbi:MAG: MarR family transcriptional regulator [Flavobacteriaceae bacterium TMED147]|jgi:DNA-binding MarR family transcriptional regulator|nr:MAG: MarR family transcriptional regulator [Flavobacteriaceae bacterium TMED147]|tara:strand:- start:66 stop:485 length:420 start_codon:yes stop_codon:yes gene_type:complete